MMPCLWRTSRFLSRPASLRSSSLIMSSTPSTKVGCISLRLAISLSESLCSWKQSQFIRLIKYTVGRKNCDWLLINGLIFVYYRQSSTIGCCNKHQTWGQMSILTKIRLNRRLYTSFQEQINALCFYLPIIIKQKIQSIFRDLHTSSNRDPSTGVDPDLVPLDSHLE